MKGVEIKIASQLSFPIENSLRNKPVLHFLKSIQIFKGISINLIYFICTAQFQLTTNPLTTVANNHLATPPVWTPTSYSQQPHKGSFNVRGTFRIHLTFLSRTMSIYTQFQKHVPIIQETIDFFFFKQKLPWTHFHQK